MAPESDDPDLRERVAELEATVEAQQATIQQLLPSRRRVLQAGGLLAGGGVLGALTADRTSADVVGQVGTQQDRVDVFGGAVDANSVNADTLAIGGQPHLSDVETGSASLSGPTAASDDGWDSVEFDTKAVSFASDFNTVPQVFTEQFNTAGVMTMASGVSTTGFTMNVLNYGTTDRSADTFDVGWLAVD